jgi:hypothetical protein
MNTVVAKVKKFAGMAVMAAAVIAVGLGLGSGTAQASPKHHPHPNITNTERSFTSAQQNFIQFTDTFIADPFQSLFGVGEGTPFDNSTDSFHHLR